MNKPLRPRNGWQHIEAVCRMNAASSISPQQWNDGKTLEFGISGLLDNSNVLLHDRTDQALWSLMKLEVASGPHAGKVLMHLPWRITSFGMFAREHPEASIVTTDTGHFRNYAQNPYRRYFATDALMLPVAHEDNRLPPRACVVGVRLGDQIRAYTLASVTAARDHTLIDQLDGKTIILKHDENGVTVLQNPGEAQVLHTFWFAWAAFHPDTSIYEPQKCVPDVRNRIPPRQTYVRRIRTYDKQFVFSIR